MLFDAFYPGSAYHMNSVFASTLVPHSLIPLTTHILDPGIVTWRSRPKIFLGSSYEKPQFVLNVVILFIN